MFDYKRDKQNREAGKGAEQRISEYLAPLEAQGYLLLRNICRLTLDDSKKEGEYDIVLLGPLGYLVLEIKTGSSTVMEASNKFYDHNSQKYIHPFQQAFEGANWLSKCIVEHFGKDRNINRAYGVVFTKGQNLVPKNSTTEEWLKVCLDADDVIKGGEYFRKRILDLWNMWSRNRNKFKKVSKEEWLEFVSKTMNFAIKSDEIRNDALQAQNMRVMRRMDRISRSGPSMIAAAPLARVLYLGGPGTGKTLILTELARKNQKKFGLCVCYNLLLCDRIRQDFKAQGIKVPVISIRDLEFAILKGSAKYEAMLQKESSIDSSLKNEFYNSELPTAVLEVMKTWRQGEPVTLS